MKKADIRKLTVLALLAGILILMASTPLGYLRIGSSLSITLNMIPVAVGAIALGPTGGAVLGAVFGITSFTQCFGTDPFGTMLMGYNPAGTFITCIGARVLAGFVTGLIFKALSRAKVPMAASFPITGLIASLSNTVFFMSSLMAFFASTPELTEMRGGMNLLLFMCVFVGINTIFEVIACTAFTSAIAAALNKAHLINFDNLKTAKSV